MDSLLLVFTSGIDDLGCVVRVFHDAGLAAKWQSIGQTLTVPDSQLESISTQFNNDMSLCLLHCMAAWLRGQKELADLPSWWRVVWVIADPLGGDKAELAYRVAAHFDGEWCYTCCMSLKAAMGWYIYIEWDF